MSGKRVLNIGMKLGVIAGALYFAYWPLANFSLDDDYLVPIISQPRPWEHLDIDYFFYWECLIFILFLVLWALSQGNYRLTVSQRVIALVGAILQSASLVMGVRVYLPVMFDLDHLSDYMGMLILISSVEMLIISFLLYWASPVKDHHTSNSHWLVKHVLQSMTLAFASVAIILLCKPCFQAEEFNDAGYNAVFFHQWIFYISIIVISIMQKRRSETNSMLAPSSATMNQ